MDKLTAQSRARLWSAMLVGALAVALSGTVVLGASRQAAASAGPGQLPTGLPPGLGTMVATLVGPEGTPAPGLPTEQATQLAPLLTAVPGELATAVPQIETLVPQVPALGLPRTAIPLLCGAGLIGAIAVGAVVAAVLLLMRGRARSLPAEPAPARTIAEPLVLPVSQPPGAMPVGEEPAFYLVSAANQRYPISAGTARIGRAADNEIVLADERVSRRHAEVRCDGSSCVLVDLGSVNGTFVNGAPVREPLRLRSGDVLNLGDTTLVFQVISPA